MSVDVSPDGSLIAFDLLGDIYIMPASGGEARLVHGGPAIQKQPRFSPDGRRIAFVSDSNGNDNIWISELDGSGERIVSSETHDRVANPAWSRDGRYIASNKVTTAVPDGFKSAIHLYHMDGGSGRILVPTTQAGKSVNEPKFAPEGGSLYYTEDTAAGGHPNHRDTNQPNYAIKRLNFSTGEVEQVARGFGSAVAAEISPDSKQLAFIRRVKDRTVLFVRDMSSGRESPVFDGLSRDAQIGLGMNSGYGYYPLYGWFPDSRHVAIWGKGKILRIDTLIGSAEEIPFRVESRHRISEAVRIRRELAPQSFDVKAITGVTTAPDGDVIVFSALGQLWRKTLPDGVPVRLTDGTEFEFEPSFSPDGKFIVYVSWRDERGAELKAVRSRGGEGKTLFASRGAIRAPVYSADGERLAFHIDPPSDLFGGYGTKPGVYHLSSAGGAAEFVIGGKHPAFDSDGTRLYYTSESIRPWGVVHDLHSVRLDGTMDRRLVTSPTGARQFRISPDGNWLAFRHHPHIYLTPYIDTGKTITVSGRNPGEFETRQLSVDSGWNLEWSRDSNHVHWMMGEQYFSTEVDAGPDEPEPVARVGLAARADLPDGTIALVGGTVVTMEDDGVLENATVLVERNRIVGVGTDVEIPESATTIDVSGKTILPGFVDMHGHLTLYRRGYSAQKHAPYFAALAYGVTTNFDPSSSDLQTATTAELIKSGRMTGPRSLGTGAIIYGYRGGAMYDGIETLGEANSIMTRKKALGFDAVKSYMLPRRRQRQQLIAAARQQGLNVIAEGELTFYNQLSMILDGHTTIEHNIPIGSFYDDVIQLASAGKTALTPTLIVTSGSIFGENYWFQKTKPWKEAKVKTYVQNTLSYYSPFGGGAAQPPHARGMIGLNVDDSIWEAGVFDIARSLKRASDAGVIVNAGSHSQINGIGFHWEIWLLAKGGMAPMDAIRAATLNPAITLGVDDQIGSIRVGKLADLIVLDGNPLEDIQNTNTVRYTMVNGRLYDSLTMNEIGNYDRPRSPFFWELRDYKGIDWNESFQGDDGSRFSGLPID